MTNTELAFEKLAAAKVIVSAAEMYQATIKRLLAESSKLIDEAEALLEGDEHGTKQGIEQG